MAICKKASWVKRRLHPLLCSVRVQQLRQYDSWISLLCWGHWQTFSPEPVALVENWPPWWLLVTFSHSSCPCSSHLSASTALCTWQPSGLPQTEWAGNTRVNYQKGWWSRTGWQWEMGVRYNFSSLRFCSKLATLLQSRSYIGNFTQNRSCSARLVNTVTITSIKAVNLVLLDRKCA